MTTAMTQAATLIELRGQLDARGAEFASALPAHITPAHFIRIALTAISQTPELLHVDRRSLLNALMRSAQDGLLPDGRQATLVIYKSKDRGPIAQYQPMVAGIRKLVQQSGEITRFEQSVVHENDKFDYRLGDRPHISHVPAIENQGRPVLVYSIAQFRDGTLSREIMTVSEIEKVRAVSRAADSGPWRDWWSEMAKKTVAKRHAKILPMSNDSAAAIIRDDDEHTTLPPVQEAAQEPAQRPRLAAQLDALADNNEAPEPRRRRGRPRKDNEPSDAEIERSQDRIGAVLGEPPDKSPPLDDNWPGPSPAYLQGMKDARAGIKSCLDREIRDDPEKSREWERGFADAQRT
jgi:recombination protein RecT